MLSIQRKRITIEEKYDGAQFCSFRDLGKIKMSGFSNDLDENHLNGKYCFCLATWSKKCIFRQLHNWVKTQKKGGIDVKGTVKAFQGTPQYKSPSDGKNVL